MVKIQYFATIERDMIATILIFLAVLSVLVIAHELGHFWAARWSGVEVEEFGIGFPPRIGYIADKKGTKWSINMIPLGGFVKLMGEDGGDKPTDFAAQSKWKRALILTAGVIMNFLLAGVIYGIVASFGAPTIMTEGEVPKFANVTDEQLLIIDVLAESAADEASIPAGSEILAINGEMNLSEEGARELLSELGEGEESAIFTLQIGQEEQEFEVSPKYLEEIEANGFGILFAQTATARYPFPISILIGFKTAAEYLVLIIVGFGTLIWGLITGSGVQEAVAGPVGIAEMTGQVARLGIIPLLNFAALLSLNLAVLNILPLPALDGGRLLFLGIEAVRGKPLKEETEGKIHQAGFLFLMIVVILVTYRDIIRLF